ncbi:MAG: DUF4845 domain-containing protein [Burkholderiales bacterium]|jgi:hypothetical protein|nr:DUF4845 domain-containing protein [Burkholderiales bacterium]
MRNRQQGISLIGFIMVCTALIFVAVFAFKLVPAYLEQYTITKIFNQIADNPEFVNATAADVRAAFVRQITIDSVKAIGPSDLDITREAGQLVIEAQYQVTIPLISNVSLLVDFKASSR